MELSKEDYQLLLELIEEEVGDKLNWLKSQKDPKYKLFNAGQIRAFSHVLDLLKMDERKAG